MKTVLFFVLILATCLNAQSINYSNSDRQMINEIFNGNFAVADSIADASISTNPNGPKYYFLKSYVLFYGRYLANSGMPRDSLINLVKHYSWKAIEEGEKREMNFADKFFVGSAYGFLSRANIMEGEFWEGYWNASKCENIMEELIEENLNFGDAYLALAILNYWPDASLTGWQSFLAWFGGMSGDRELGLAYLKKTIEYGELFKNESDYLGALSFGAFFENNPVEAYNSWAKLSEKFPSNRIFELQKNRAYVGYIIDTQGTDFLDSDLQQLQTTYKIDNQFVLNIVGYSYINKEEYNTALKVFSTNIKLYPHVANCYDSFAECYMNMGDYDNAIKYYNIAYKKLETDTTANDNFKNLLREGIKERLDDMGGELNI